MSLKSCGCTLPVPRRDGHGPLRQVGLHDRGWEVKPRRDPPVEYRRSALWNGVVAIRRIKIMHESRWNWDYPAIFGARCGADETYRLSRADSLWVDKFTRRVTKREAAVADPRLVDYVAGCPGF